MYWRSSAPALPTLPAYGVPPRVRLEARGFSMPPVSVISSKPRPERRPARPDLPASSGEKLMKSIERPTVNATPTPLFTLPLGKRICETPTPVYQPLFSVRSESSGRSIRPPPKRICWLDRPPPAPTYRLAARCVLPDKRQRRWPVKPTVKMPP